MERSQRIWKDLIGHGRSENIQGSTKGFILLYLNLLESSSTLSMGKITPILWAFKIKMHICSCNQICSSQKASLLDHLQVGIFFTLLTGHYEPKASNFQKVPVSLCTLIFGKKEDERTLGKQDPKFALTFWLLISLYSRISVFLKPRPFKFLQFSEATKFFVLSTS